MSRAQITLSGKFDRDRAIKWIGQAPAGTRVIFKDSKRSLPQNEKMWAALTEIAAQVEWHGQKLTPDDWKLIFLDALKRELRLAPNIDGTGFVNLGRSSSNLSKADFSDLLELINAFAANHDVHFRGEPPIEEGQAA
jgi:hypothetical protein